MNQTENHFKGELLFNLKRLSLCFLFISLFILQMSCSITAVRPSQEMSNMEVAIKAAKEVNADVLAPELFRLALETSQNARREYRMKNFMDAKKHSDQARVYAERAEFESIRNGGKRDALPEDPLAEPSYAPEPLAAPTGGAGGEQPAASPSANQK